MLTTAAERVQPCGVKKQLSPKGLEFHDAKNLGMYRSPGGDTTLPILKPLEDCFWSCFPWNRALTRGVGRRRNTPTSRSGRLPKTAVLVWLDYSSSECFMECSVFGFFCVFSQTHMPVFFHVWWIFIVYSEITSLACASVIVFHSFCYSFVLFSTS